MNNIIKRAKEIIKYVANLSDEDFERSVTSLNENNSLEIISIHLEYYRQISMKISVRKENLMNGYVLDEWNKLTPDEPGWYLFRESLAVEEKLAIKMFISDQHCINPESIPKGYYKFVSGIGVKY